METVEEVAYRPISIERLQKLIKKHYGRKYEFADREGYVETMARYVIQGNMTTDQDAPYHMEIVQRFRTSGDFCPLFILIGVLVYRNIMPPGRYLLRVGRQ